MAHVSDKYAIILIAGKQMLVCDGDVVSVEISHASDTLSFPVLFAKDGAKVRVGTPYVDDIRVEGTVMKRYRGDKIRVAKFKAKSNYHRVKGYRPQLSLVKVHFL